MKHQLKIRQLGTCDYDTAWEEMRNFTQRRKEHTTDEIWLLQHPPVFTLGQAGKEEHVLSPGTIPLIKTDRGGQVTYHGPGQVVAYLLLDIKRKQLGVKKFVEIIEQTIIETLSCYKITANTKENAPGVYVDEAKIASIGLRVRHGCSYHGLSLNVNMDLEPFSRINPCGYKGLKITQINDLLGKMGKTVILDDIEALLVQQLANNLGYTILEQQHGWDKS